MENTDLTVADIVRLYLAHSAANGIHCAEARQDRERTLAKFVVAAGHVALADLKPYHLTDFVADHPQWKSADTRRSKANTVKACFQWAADQERITRNPFKAVRFPGGERRPDLADSDLETIAELGNKCFERAVRFLRLTGCRLGELCEARWPHVDLARGIWVIERHKTRKHTKRSKMVVLVDEAVEMLRQLVEHPSRPTEVEHIFLNTAGRPWNRRTLGQTLLRLKKRYGLNVEATLHGIRHRFGSAGVAAGAPIKLISLQMGHESVTTTERFYVNLAGEVESIRNAAQLATRKSPE